VNAIQTVQALIACCDAWEPSVCVMGNVRAGDAAAALRALLAQLQAGETARPQTWDRDDIEAVISCLGDDAAQLRDENQEDERADNMDRAASMLTVFAMREYAAAPAVAQMLTDTEIVRAIQMYGPHENIYSARAAIRAFAAKNGLTLPEGANNADQAGE
jgi:hypothetical protein